MDAAEPVVASDVEQPAEKWPFFRRDPDRIVLGVRPGHDATDRPPVRIFLGTEEAQYRAERIFFYSIEKVRDPGRVYEIHLMKNIRGFDRRRWRTGFTNYRYAIPEFAGGTGKAIYNDVDQIYLADPALLFDLEMGEHGYLAISAKDTSVMLIDCARMLPIWNRETAGRLGKHALIDEPAKRPGLWGALDGHWNARDQEYVEGLTKCLHYTALHQQPWQPFPELFSYHPNPLAYIWHDLEREADAQDFQLFDAGHPSPDFERLLHTEATLEPAGVPVPEAARTFLDEHRVERVLCVTAQESETDFSALTRGREAHRFALTEGAWPEGPYDAVLAADLFERLPPADIPWLLDALFSRARKAVHVRLTATEPEGLGSVAWWCKRLDEAAARTSGPSWRLDATDKGAALPDTLAGIRTDRTAEPARPQVWALLDGDPAHDARVRKLAEALEWPTQFKRLRFNALAGRPRLRHGASTAGLDLGRCDPLDGPLPDLVVAAGWKSAPVAAWIKKTSGGHTRLVQLGRPRIAFGGFDLILTTPDERLPIRDNVLHLTAPLAEAPDGARPDEGSGEATAPRLEHEGDAPRTLLLLGRGRRPYRLTAAAVTRLAEMLDAEQRRAGGGLSVAVEAGVPEVVTRAFEQRLGGACTRLGTYRRPGETPPADDTAHVAATSGNGGLDLDAALAAADRIVLVGDDLELLARACRTGKPVALFELPRRHDTLPGGRRLAALAALLAGGGTSYRGTPHQQHLVARGLDHLTTRGRFHMPADPSRLHRALLARGLLIRLGDETAMATPKPLDDLERATARIRRMMSERRSRAQLRYPG
ncbi:MAG: mitochondrial fission ELM1 family protein [Geminicoccaceae bacterium]|nr:mitochondrial fission ELM1 family protein [Geminicoccaceae bacterium]